MTGSGSCFTFSNLKLLVGKDNLEVLRVQLGESVDHVGTELAWDVLWNVDAITGAVAAPVGKVADDVLASSGRPGGMVLVRLDLQGLGLVLQVGGEGVGHQVRLEDVGGRSDVVDSRHLVVQAPVTLSVIDSPFPAQYFQCGIYLNWA